MHYVYLIRSVPSPSEKYVGLSKDLKQRLSEHNAESRLTPPNSDRGN